MIFVKTEACKKVKESRNRPAVAQRVSGGLGWYWFLVLIFTRV
jgi:hypothetical protein